MNIFLSYRREDSRPFTERIYDRLVESFGVDHVFKDVDRIRPGTSFAEVLESELDRSDVMLVIIGKQWATITAKDTQQPRLNNPDDWVRLEVERGLSREDVRVIPVLVDGARLPARDDLPSSLHDLLGRQIAEVRYDPDFHRDMDRLIEALLPPPPPEPAPKRPPWLIPGLAVLLVGVFAAVLLASSSGLFNPQAPLSTATETTAPQPSLPPTTETTAAPPSSTAPAPTDVPTPAGDPIGWPVQMQAQVIGDFVRVRREPSSASPMIATANGGDLVEVVDVRSSVRELVGQRGEWILVRVPNDEVGWVDAASLELVPELLPIGVNLQPNNPQGLPDPAQLGTIRWVRLVYNVSFDPVDGTYGNLDVNAAYEHYHSAIERYANAGYRVMLVFNHQTYGEGQGWNWYEITPADWLKFTNKFALMAGQIAGQYAQDHLVDAYQIWQEPDSPQSAVSVSMPAASYADVLKESTLTIRAALQEANDDAVILTAGLISGPDQAANYLDTVLTTMGDVRPDGVAFHPYGRGAQPGPLASFGTIGESIRALQAVAPDLPLWITEWGVAQPPDSVEGEAVADYAWDVIENLQTDYAGQVEAAIWFAWADSGFDAYGVVDENGTPREPLYSVLATWN